MKSQYAKTISVAAETDSKKLIHKQDVVIHRQRDAISNKLSNTEKSPHIYLLLVIAVDTCVFQLTAHDWLRTS